MVHFCDRVFAELDDKTPLAMLLSAAEHNTSNVGVCIASSGALVRSKLHRGLGWFPAFDLYPAIPPHALKLTAEVGFMAIGSWVLIDSRASHLVRHRKYVVSKLVGVGPVGRIFHSP